MGRFLRQLHRAIREDGAQGDAEGSSQGGDQGSQGSQGSLIEPGDGVILAVSGGPDSMALLHGMVGVNGAFGMQLRLHVAHLNHRTRGPASDGDAAFVAAEAERLGLPATIESQDVPAQTGPAGGGLERAGRAARYGFFARLARQENCRVVATGHQADDNAETILQRIIRGTGPRGLAGIPPRRALAPDAVLADGRPIQLVRPLLQFRRRVIGRVLSANGIAFRTDASNLAAEPTRNWLRNELMPLLARRGNPGVVGALLRLGELGGWVNAFVEETARRMLASLVIDRTDMQLTLNASSLAGKRPILQAEIIRQAIISFGRSEAEMGLRHLKAVMRLAEQGESGKQVHLPGRLSVSLKGEQLLLTRGRAGPAEPLGAAPPAGDLTVQLPGCTPLPVGRRQLVIELMENRPGLLVEFKARKTAEAELVDADRFRPPLVVRTRRPGDRFWPLGSSGTKKVSDFLADQKVPIIERDRVCLLCDQLGPVWVIPYRIDDRVRVSERSRNLALLRIEPAAG